MLAMVVNDNAGSLIPHGVFKSIASMLAPTGGGVIHALNGRQSPTPSYYCAQLPHL